MKTKMFRRLGLILLLGMVIGLTGCKKKKPFKPNALCVDAYKHAFSIVSKEKKRLVLALFTKVNGKPADHQTLLKESIEVLKKLTGNIGLKMDSKNPKKHLSHEDVVDLLMDKKGKDSPKNKDYQALVKRHASIYKSFKALNSKRGKGIALKRCTGYEAGYAKKVKAKKGKAGASKTNCTLKAKTVAGIRACYAKKKSASGTSKTKKAPAKRPAAKRKAAPKTEKRPAAPTKKAAAPAKRPAAPVKKAKAPAKRK